MKLKVLVPMIIKRYYNGICDPNCAWLFRGKCMLRGPLKKLRYTDAGHHATKFCLSCAVQEPEEKKK